MSAPNKFTVPLTRAAARKYPQRGTQAERALLRLYFMAGGFDVETAEGSVYRWSYATNAKEFNVKLAQATKWGETVEFETPRRR